MRNAIISVLLSFALSLGADARACKLDDSNVELSPELLSMLGYSPRQLMFKYLVFENLSVSFRSPVMRFLDGTTADEETKESVVPIEINLVGWVNSPRKDFIEHIKDQLTSRPGVSMAVVRGYMKYVATTKLKLDASVESTVRKGGITARFHTPVSLTITLKRKQQGRDLGIELNAKVGSTYGSSSAADLLDLAVFPLTIALDILDQPSVGEAILNDAEAKADKEVEGLTGEIEGLENQFNLESLDRELRMMIGEFGELFDERLQYTKTSGFLGANVFEYTRKGYERIIGDARVALRLNKVSVENAESSYLSMTEACELRETLNFLESLSEQVRRTTGRDRKTEILDELWRDRLIESEYREQMRHQLGLDRPEQVLP